MVKICIRHGMVVDKIHQIISFKQSKWLEIYINFNIQKRNKTINKFGNDFYKLLNIVFYGKTNESVKKRVYKEFMRKMRKKQIIKQQSNLTFNGIHNSYEKCDSYTFKQIGVTMDKPIYLGFAILELSKLLLYETYYGKLQRYFREKNLQCQYMESVTKDTPILLKVDGIIQI